MLPLLLLAAALAAPEPRPSDVPPAAVARSAPSPELHHVPTEDGYEVALTRYANPGRPAVVLCHGISSNHHFWDLEPGRSLALHLYEAGFDVWNMDLRGHGSAVRGSDASRQKSGWTVDDYGERDLPAAFAFVQQQTGTEKLHYVGHSMGGMVLAVYLATQSDPPLASAVLVGSPLDFRDPDRLTRALFVAGPFATAPAFLPSQLGAPMLGWIDTHAPLAADELLYNPDNMNREARRLMLARVVSPLSRGEIRQMALSRTGEFRSADGERVYRELLGEVTVPMLFVAGRADRVVNPDRVYGYYEAVGSPDKEFVIVSVANGFRGDYGHLDLGLGDHAAEDVFPRITEWLQRHP